MAIIVYVDGLCEPVNPGGTATYGFIIRNDLDVVIAKDSGVAGTGPRMSNNVAEYAALCEALQVLLRQKMMKRPIEVRSDSKLLVNQMNGDWKFHKGLYGEKYRDARDLAERFEKLGFKWVPREENKEADGLTREAYERSK